MHDRGIVVVFSIIRKSQIATLIKISVGTLNNVLVENGDIGIAVFSLVLVDEAWKFEFFQKNKIFENPRSVNALYRDTYQ